MSCLSCEELEAKICELAEALSDASCNTIVREGDTVIDRTPELKARQAALSTYQKLYESKRCSDTGDIFEMVGTACTTQTKCTVNRCGSFRRKRGVRRY